MSIDLPEMGKISPEAFTHFIYPQLGSPSENILVGPQSGVDIGVVRVSPGTVMAMTTDPVFVVPNYGWERAAWFAVQILASDAATSGLTPSLMTVDLNLPLSMTTDDFGHFWKAWHEACADLGISIVSGHTARYEGCTFPMVGGATVMAIGAEDQYISTNQAQVGDVVLCTKGAAIEATALFAASYPKTLRQALGEKVWRAADSLFEQMSVVRDAKIAASVGVRQRGVTAMHDATECGVVGGVYEMAESSQLGVVLEEEAIPVPWPVRETMHFIGIDPLIAISEGTLLLTVRPHRVDAVIGALQDAHIEVARIGYMTSSQEGRWRFSQGRQQPLIHPRLDPFWEAFGRAQQAGWS